MMDRSAIEAIAEKSALNEINNDLVELELPVKALPHNADLRSLEVFQPERNRFRGSMKTPSINDFSAYARVNNVDHAACFIDVEDMNAVAVINLGNLDKPGHCDHCAHLKLKQSTEYRVLLHFHSLKHSQKAFTEWLEDWANNIKVFDHEEKPLDLKKTIGAIRRLTIESKSEHSHTEENFKATRSALESVEAKSKGNTLPAWLDFTLQPYADFKERTVRLRVAVLTGSTAPTLTAHICGLEALEQELAEEFQQKVEDKLDGIMPTYLGTFNP